MDIPNCSSLIKQISFKLHRGGLCFLFFRNKYWDSLRKKCPYSELFWSLFSRIRTKITPNTDTFHPMANMMNYNDLDKYTRKCRFSHRRCSIKRGSQNFFARFTRKHLHQRFFFNDVAVFRPVTLLKNRLGHWCFPVSFKKFLRTENLRATASKMIFGDVCM